jgi:hydroxyacylglutathione hydrolase
MKQHTIMTPYMVGEVHFYSSDVDGEIVLFDTGPPTAEGRCELERAVDMNRLKHVFVTHCHVDHYGLAAYIEERCDARIYFPRIDIMKLQKTREWLLALEALVAEGGFDADFFHTLSELFQGNQTRTPCPRNYLVAEDCPDLERLGISIINCPSHSQSDLVYVHDGFAVTGDILLRDIFQSPLLGPDVRDVSKRFRNYDAYCASIPRLVALKELTILPAHRNFIEGVEETVLFYVRKLLERAGQVKRFSGGTVSDVVERIFGTRSRDPLVMYLKVSEIYFMHDFLADPERLKGALEQVGLFGQVRDLYLSVSA